jgi:hypothetical protein
MSPATRINARQSASMGVEAAEVRVFPVEAIPRSYVTTPPARPARNAGRADEFAATIRPR